MPARLPREAVQQSLGSHFETSHPCLVIENEFFRVEQRPEQISQHFLLLLRVFEKTFQLRKLFVCWLAREATEVQISDDLVSFLARFEHLLNHAALIDFVADRIPI